MEEKRNYSNQQSNSAFQPQIYRQSGFEKTSRGRSEIHSSSAPTSSNSQQLLVGVIDEGFGVGEHGAEIVKTIADSNPQSPAWLGQGVSNGNWAESLTKFVDAAKTLGRKAVANLSFDLTEQHPDGRVTTRSQLTTAEQQALSYAHDNGVLIVASSGNQGSAMSALGQASQQFDNIIAVGAAEGNHRADYSSYGNGLDLVAIGQQAGDAFTGTSRSAAEVTGTISQMWAANSTLDYRQVTGALESTATDLQKPGWDAETGAGLLNSTAAVNLAKTITPATRQFSGAQLIQQVNGSFNNTPWTSVDGTVASERTNREIIGTGSLSSAEETRLQAAAKPRRSAKSESADEKAEGRRRAARRRANLTGLSQELAQLAEEKAEGWRRAARKGGGSTENLKERDAVSSGKGGSSGKGKPSSDGKKGGSSSFTPPIVRTNHYERQEQAKSEQERKLADLGGLSKELAQLAEEKAEGRRRASGKGVGSPSSPLPGRKDRGAPLPPFGLAKQNQMDQYDVAVERRLPPPSPPWQSVLDDDFPLFPQRPRTVPANFQGPIQPGAVRESPKPPQHPRRTVPANFQGPIQPGAVRESPKPPQPAPTTVPANSQDPIQPGAVRESPPFNTDWKIDKALSGHGRDLEWSQAINRDQCLSYSGGGFMTGPDGKRYPIVIPEIREDGHTYTADVGVPHAGKQPVFSLGGSDPGWRTIYQTDKTGSLEPTTAGERVAGGVGATAGWQVTALPKGDYKYLSIDHNGDPSLSSKPEDDLQSPLQNYDPERRMRQIRLKDGTILDVNANDVRQQIANNKYEIEESADIPPPKSARIANNASKGVDLGVTVGQGLAAAATIDDAKLYRYQVKFESNQDGRRRAIINAYHLDRKRDGSISIAPYHVYVNDEGEITRDFIYYRQGDTVSEVQNDWSVIRAKK